MLNKVHSAIYLPGENRLEENDDEHETEITIDGKAIVKYIDKNTGREISSSVTKTGKVGTEFDVSEDKKVGSVVEVNSETDFVAKNEEFRAFVNDIAKQVATKNPATVEELLSQKYLDTESTVQEVLTSKIATIGENMSVRRFARYESQGLVESYIHGDGKIAVLVNFEKGEETLAKDVCMQIAAAKPEYLSREEVPAEAVQKEMEILKVQAMNEGKPAEIAEKMVQGRIGKFYSEICLLDQEFVKDASMKVGDLIKSKDGKIVAFSRFEKGEGIEKVEENFAEEVMKQIK